ncbi:SMC-Scp complex subunit ScpB, partial [Marinospirillum sp.]|uniref:SMC-Scp complex subunit ScpB n=1 Tax=Marinospirillum sp. TaxID=2183934 RepID=UPI003A8A7F87
SLESIQSPFEMVEVAQGFRFRTRSKFYPFVRKLFGEAPVRKLSQAALETLAIIAYKQPITKADLEAVRGVSCDGPLRNLLEKKMIALGARQEGPGNPFTYVTTKEFLKYFGINRIPEDLPRLSELEDILRANELVPQHREAPSMRQTQTHDPNQLELSIGED